MELKHFLHKYPEAYVCVASVLAVPDSHAKSTNAATQDADVNEASCFLSSLFKTGATACNDTCLT